MSVVGNAVKSRPFSLWTFLCIALLGGISTGIARVSIIFFAVDLKASSFQIGLVDGLQNIGVLALALPMGFLIDRFGARRLYIIGGLLGAFVYLILPFSGTAGVLLSLTTILGLFIPFRFIPLNSLFIDNLKSLGNEKAGWYRGAYSLGLAFIGPFAGAFLVKRAGYHGSFTVATLAVVGAVLAARRYLPSGERSRDQVKFSFSEAFSHIRELARQKELLSASIAEAISTASFSYFVAFIVVIGLRVFHLSKPAAVVFLTIEGTLFIFSLFFLGLLVKRMGQRKFIVVGNAVSIAGLALLGIASSIPVLYAGATLIGIGLGMINVVNVARIANTEGPKGKIAGFFSLFTISGMIAGPILGGVLGHSLGLQKVFWLQIPLFVGLIGHTILQKKPTVSQIKKSLGWIGDKALGLILPAALIYAWTWVTKRGLFAEQLMVPIPITWETFLDLLHSGELALNLKVSLIRVLEGFALGGSAGFVLGTAMGLSKTVESYVSPFFNAIRQVPIFAWVPLLMLAVGVDEQFKVIFIAVGAFYPMVINTFQGIKGVPKEFNDVAKVFEYRGLALFRKVILPGAMPSILTGLRLALSMSWMSVVGAEFIASSEGIGYMMVFGRQLMQIDVVMVGVVVIGIVGLLMDSSVRLLERYLLRWRRVNANAG